MYKTIYLVVLGVIGFISPSSCFGLKRYPSNRMLDFNWPEPDGRIQRYPHEKYCHYYYKHESDEFFTIRKCPTGEMFDYHVHECREKDSAQCWSHHYGKHAVHDHIHSKWRKHFKCPFPEGNYPDIFDCEKYIVCLAGKPHHKHCAPNHQFDKNRRHCVYAANCANSTDAALVAHMCPYPSGNFAYTEDCSKYYKCHRSEPTVKTCENNKLFDEEDRECKDSGLVHCKDRPNPYRKTFSKVPNVESETTDDFQSSTVKTDISAKTADSKTDANNKQLATTMSVEISGKTDVTGDKSTAESITASDATGNINSSEPSANTNQSVMHSEATNNSQKSMSSTNSAESTTQSEQATNNPHSSVQPIDSVVSIVQSNVTTDNPLPSKNVV